MEITIAAREVNQYKIGEEHIVSVYSGKPHTCMCGCAGKHYYASKHRKYAGKDRGYDVLDNEVSDKMVRKVMRLFSEFKGTIDCIDGYIFTIEISDKRQYTIYLSKPR